MLEGCVVFKVVLPSAEAEIATGGAGCRHVVDVEGFWWHESVGGDGVVIDAGLRLDVAGGEREDGIVKQRELRERKSPATRREGAKCAARRP